MAKSFFAPTTQGFARSHLFKLLSWIKAIIMAERDEGHRSDAATTSGVLNEKQPQQQHTPPSTFSSILTSTLIFSLVVVGLAAFAPDAWRIVCTNALDGLNRAVRPPFGFGGPELRLNVSSCPGEFLQRSVIECGQTETRLVN